MSFFPLNLFLRSTYFSLELVFSVYLQLSSIAFLYLSADVGAASLTYFVLKGKGFASVSVSTSSFTVSAAVSESTCALTCIYASTSTSNSLSSSAATATNACVAAQYDSATKQCIMMMSGCTFMALVDNSTSTTYAPTSSVTKIDADLFYPLALSCGLSIALNYAQLLTSTSASISTPAAVNVPAFVPYSLTSRLAAATWLNNNPPIYPATDYFEFYSSAPSYAFDIFDASFTVSFFVTTALYGSAWLGDQPILEFLGAAAGQICFAWRLGNYATAVHFAVVPDCNYTLVNGIVPYFSSNVVNYGAFHYALVYNSEMKTVTIYLNGVFSSITSQAIKSIPYNITRMKVGATDAPNWFGGWYNGLYGSVGCIQLFGKTVSNLQVADLYTFCNSSALQILIK